LSRRRDLAPSGRTGTTANYGKPGFRLLPGNGTAPLSVVHAFVFSLTLIGSNPLIVTGSVVMEPFVGQIELFAFSFAPEGFAPCNGALLPISENTVLYSLLGTTYGGDGKTTFGLPNLAPVTPQGPGYYIAVYGVAPPTQ